MAMEEDHLYPFKDRGLPWSVQHPTVDHPDGAAIEAEALAEAEVEVEAAVVEVVAGTVLLVFDLNAVNRQDPPHFEYMSPAHVMLQSEVAATCPPCVLPQ